MLTGGKRTIVRREREIVKKRLPRGKGDCQVHRRILSGIEGDCQESKVVRWREGYCQEREIVRWREGYC